MRVSHCPTPEELAGLVEGVLSGDALKRVAAHVDACPVCLAAAQEFRPTDVVLSTLRRGAAPSAPPTDQRDRYSPLRLHAAGGLGEVHVAEDTELGRKVALKQIRPARADDPDSRRRFLREAEITARLEHPGIVPVYGLVWDAQGRPRYAMRLIEGESLLAAVRAFHSAEGQSGDPGERALALRGLLGRFVAVCQTVAYAHSRGVVHRDIKPSNIMLGPYGETLLVDWGLAKSGVGDQQPDVVEGLARDTVTDLPSTGDTGGTQPGAVLGTRAYMSPEQAEGRHDEVGPASDIYLLGGTLYTILTGRVPFEDGEGAGRGKVVPPRQVNRSVPAALEAVCLKAMETHPDNRYASAADLGAEVERWLAGEPVQAHPEGLAARAGRWTRRHRVLVVGLVVAAVLGSGGGVWLAREAADRRAERARLEVKDREAVVQALGEVPVLVRTWRFREAILLLDQTTAGLSEYAPAEDRARLAEALTDIRLAERLDAIRLDGSDTLKGRVLTGAAAAADYQKAFAARGLDCTGGDPTAVGVRVAASPVREALLAALDDWASKESDAVRRDLVTRVARAADPDPAWRDRFREALARRDRAALRGLAKEADVDRLTPAALAALGKSLGEQTPEALELLSRAQARDPADYWLNFWLASGLQGAAPPRTAEAVAHYRAAIAARPRAAVAHVNLGSALRAQGNSQGGEAACRRALEIDPNIASAHNNLGNILADRGDGIGAEAAYRRAIELDPSFALAHTNLGNTLRQRGDLAGAEAAYRRAVELDPDDAVVQNNFGSFLGERGDSAGEVAAYRRAVELEPWYIAAHHNLGHALHELRDYAGAEAAFGRMTELDPMNAEAHCYLGIVRRKGGNAAGAEAPFRRALELNPRFTVARLELALVLQINGDRAGGDAEIRRAVELDPKNAMAQYQMGNILRNRGDLAGAAAAYRRAIALEPKHTPAQNNLGQVLMMVGDLTGAETAFRRTIELDPKLALSHMNLGAVLLARWDNAGAEAAFRRAAEIDPKLAPAHDNRAHALMQLGRFEEALAVARRALELFPPGKPGHDAAAERVRRCERMIQLDGKLPAVIRGEDRPADREEHVTLAGLAAVRRQYAASARLYEELLRKHPPADGAGDDRRANAARAAARAGCGHGADNPAPDADERTRLRRQALDWLRADLKGRMAGLAAADPKLKDAARWALRHWQSDPDLAVVRDAAGLAALPADEREAWRQFWADVAAALPPERK